MAEDIAKLKKQVRAQALQCRDDLEPAYRIEMAARIADQCHQIDILPGTIVSGFLPIRSELDVRPLMMAFAERGAQLCVPAMLDRVTIEFRALVRGAPLIDNGFGTVSPPADADILTPELMLVPLAAFDRNGNRAGYGAGYYDRAIARIHAGGGRPRLIGMAFDCQEVDHVPSEDHDIPLPEIWTESGLKNLPAVL